MKNHQFKIKIVPILFVLILVVLLTFFAAFKYRPYVFDELIELGDIFVPLRLDGSLILIEEPSFPKEFEFNINNLYLEFDFSDGIHSTCVKSIEVIIGLYPLYHIDEENGKLIDDFYLGRDYKPEDYVCAEKMPMMENGGHIALSIDDDHKIKTRFNDSVFYLYPYDTIIMQIDSRIDLISYNATGKVIEEYHSPASITLFIDAPNHEIYTLNSNSNGYILKISRPRTIQFLIPLIMCFFAFFILLIPLNDNPTAIGIAIALFLGLWSVKPALLPEEIPGIHAIEIIMLGEYIIIGIAIIILPSIKQIVSWKKRDKKKS